MALYSIGYYGTGAVFLATSTQVHLLPKKCIIHNRKYFVVLCSEARLPPSRMQICVRAGEGGV